jgi:hypothetical protein
LGQRTNTRESAVARPTGAVEVGMRDAQCSADGGHHARSRVSAFRADRRIHRGFYGDHDAPGFVMSLFGAIVLVIVYHAITVRRFV